MYQFGDAAGKQVTVKGCQQTRLPRAPALASVGGGCGKGDAPLSSPKPRHVSCLR